MNSDDQKVEAFPLQWPTGRTRTGHRRRSNFGDFNGVNLGRAHDRVIAELGRLGAKDPVISTNLRLRMDGLLRAAQSDPADPGVAVYFVHQKKRLCFACDRWDKVADNLWSIAKTIEAIRGIQRWGTGEMVAAALAGFRALPPPQKPWRMVFGYGSETTPLLADVEKKYRTAAELNHPDRCGNPDTMAELNAARDDARAELS